MASDASATFAELLRRHRLSAGLTQEDLAERAGLSSRGIQDLERGARTAPRAETVRLLSAALALNDGERAALIAAANQGLASRTAPRAGRRSPSLPAPLTALVGRERDVTVACALLRRTQEVEDSRLVTFTGPGGVGKTRLAMAVAHEVAAEFADGAVWVELAPARDPDVVPAALARALRIPEDGERPLAEALADAVAERNQLLVLDNCEHLLSAMPLLSQLLAAGPRLAILATSRSRLRLRGEREVPIGPLAVPEAVSAQTPIAGLAGVAAVRLFVERAQAVAPWFALTVETAPAVTAICRRLEGLPLALELAAARVKVLPPAQLLELLERRLPMLSGGAQDLPLRQQTMRDAIAWSYDLLTPEEQALFRRLAVFAGGFDLGGDAFGLGGVGPAGLRGERGEGDESETAVSSPSLPLSPLSEAAPPERSDTPSIIDLVASLVDQSLLRAVEGSGDWPRFAMLETIREFGLEQLAARGELDAIHRSHATSMLALVEEGEPHLGGSGQARWLDRLDREADNLREALRWAVEMGHGDLALRLAGALWPFWSIRGHVRDGRAWLERVRALPDVARAPAEQRARVLTGLGVLAMNMGDYADAQAHLEESLALRQDLGHRREIAATLQHLALVAQHQQEYSRATTLYAQSLEIARETGNDQAMVIALNGLAIAAQMDGDVPRANALYAESLEIARRLGAPRHIAIAVGNLGNLAADEGDHEQAAALYEESLSRYREIGDLRGVGICLYSLGQQAVTRGDPRADDLLAEALLIFVDLGDQSAIAETLDVLARTLAERGVAATAARLIGATALLRERTGIPAPADPHYRADHARAVHLIQASLGADAIAAAIHAVRDLPLDAAVSEALAALRPHPSPDLGQESGAERVDAGG